MAGYKIGGVPETMIQTLYARAKESKKIILKSTMKKRLK